MLLTGNAVRMQSAQEAEQRGRAGLRRFVPVPVERSVSADRYINVNIEAGEFATGKSAGEKDRRFEFMYPGALGWSQGFGELVDEQQAQ